MTLDIILSSLCIGGITLLWKLLRKEHFVSVRIDKLKPIMRRQLVCSSCFIFWISFIFSFFFRPLRGWIPRLQGDVLWGESFLIPFIFQGFILAIMSSLWFYLAIILIERSHTLTEEAAQKS